MTEDNIRINLPDLQQMAEHGVGHPPMGIETRKRWTLSEILMTLATMLAAVAAICSAYAAFRQERATFTNNLYSKQVDAVSGLLAAYARSLAKLARMANDGKDTTNGVPGYKLFSNLEIQNIAAPDDNIQLKFYAAAIILPDHIDAKLKALNLAIFDTKFAVTGAFGKNSTEHDFREFVYKIDHLGNDFDTVRVCLSEQFRIGSPISDPPFDACMRGANSFDK